MLHFFCFLRTYAFFETDYERSMKLIKYAMGRGFTLDIIRLCIDDVTIVDDIDDNDED